MKVTVIKKEGCPYCDRLFEVLKHRRLRQDIQLEILEDGSVESMEYDYYYLPAVFAEDQRRIHGKAEKEQLLAFLADISESME